MKNLFILLFAFSFSVTGLMAQDLEKDMKNAAKTVSKKSTDAIANSSEILDAVNQIDKLMDEPTIQASKKALITAAEALNQLANEEFKAKTIDATGQYQLVVPNSAILAFEAFAGAAKIDMKDKDLKYGLQDSENLLNNYAIFAYQEQDYGKAYQNFAASIEAHDLLKSMGQDSRLQEGSLLADQYFFTAVSAYYDNQFELAKPYLLKLYNDDSSEAFVYDALYNVTAEADLDQALIYLSKGREMNPDDTGLLFTEINHYLKLGELDVLIDKLKSAIEKEPDNISVYTTLGSVYDQLHQNAYSEGDTEKATEYYDNAYSWYSQVLDRDADNFDATYSIGALYYNKAASFVDKLNELATDLSPAGMKAYDETKAEMDALFKEALPYFEKADKINSEDRNTLIALREIYARLNMLDKSEKFKARLEALGITN